MLLLLALWTGAIHGYVNFWWFVDAATVVLVAIIY
jgi:hypothetical protein